MRASGRSANVSLNATISLVCQFLNIIVAFVSRTYFIRFLGADYLGVSGLFTNILTVLSFADLGIGNAMLYRLYKPVALGEFEHINALLRFYKKLYFGIGVIILSCGLMVIPFLNFIIKEPPNIPENIYIIYILYLFNSSVTYFFGSYKAMLLQADQRAYVSEIIIETVTIVQNVVQLVGLWMCRNYMLYLCLMIVGSMSINIIRGIVVQRMYPQLGKHSCKVDKEIKSNIFNDTKSFAIHKIGNVITNGTDNILISALVNVTSVGLVSNYVLLTNYGNAILSKIMQAFTGSLGNLSAVENDINKLKDIFYKVLFISAWLYGFLGVGIAVTANSFITAWLGDKYLLGMGVIVAIVLDFYVRGVQYVTETYRTVFGYFRQGKYMALVGAVINVALSIALCNKIGLTGIFVATPISKLITTGIIDPFLIYTRRFHDNPIKYFVKYYMYIGLFGVVGVACVKIISYLKLTGWGTFLVSVLIVTVVFNGVMVALFGRTKMFRELMSTAKNTIKRKRV